MDTDIVAVEKEEREQDACDQYFLPYDLLLEIFSYLPAKMILQLQLLSRPFRHLAADRRFRLLQSQRHLAASGVFIVAPFDLQLDFFPLDNAAGLPPSFYAHLKDIRTVAFFLASSRGLLFFRYYTCANLLVLNPTCRERRMLPAPPEKGCPLSGYNGLAVNFLDNDDHLKCKYQLVYLKPMRSSVSSSLYQLCLYDSAAAGDWTVHDRQVDLGSPYLNLKNLVVFEGSVFVSFSSSSRVAAVDTSTRHVNFLPVPDSVSQGDEINVAVWEEAGNRPWLCLVHYDRRSCKFTLWRWSKGSMWVKFNEVAVDRRRHEKTIKYFILHDGGAMNGMLLYFDARNSAYAYSFKWQQFIELRTKKERKYYTRFIAYTNSLRPYC